MIMLNIPPSMHLDNWIVLGFVVTLNQRWVIYDNGTEFISCNFQELLKCYNVKGQPTTVKNPQADLLVECFHGQLGNQLQTMIFEGSDFYDDLDTMV